MLTPRMSTFSLLTIIILVPPALFDFNADQGFTFLIEGEQLQYAGITKVDRVTLEILIPFSRSDTQKVLEIYNKLLTRWNNLPAFNEATTDNSLTIAYLSLAAIPVKQILALSHTISQVYNFKDTASLRTPDALCKYTHTEVALSDMKTQAANVQTSFSHIDKLWSLETVQADPTKDLILRTAMLTLAEASGILTKSFNELFSVVDTLASNKMPEAVRGMYHTAPCIGILFEEKITVLDCFPSITGYICDLEIQSPVKVLDVLELFPVHYNDIRLVGKTDDERFISVLGTHDIKSLKCDHYVFNQEDLPSCFLNDLNDLCQKALKKNNIDNIINHCRFISEEPFLYRQTKSNSFLIQGQDVLISQLINGEYTPLTVPDTPLLILSPNTLKIMTHQQEWILTPADTSVVLTVKNSLLSLDQIQDLESKYYFQHLLETMDSEDYVRHSLLILQIILYPLAIVGLILGVYVRKHLLSVLARGKTKPTAYASNKIAMQTLLKK